MSLLVDAIRPSWIPGLNAVTGKQTAGIAAWVAQGKYQIYSNISSGSASLSYADAREVTEAFAADCSRFAVAAIETIEGLAPSEDLPKSTGWLAIRTYYAAFFAAQSVLRTLGVSCTKFELGQSAAVNNVASIFGTSASTALVTGLYECRLDIPAKSLSVSQIAVRGGSHVATWHTLYHELGAVSARVLVGALPTKLAQQASSAIDDLRTILSDYGTVPNGSWLSRTRNRVNYDLEFGAWHPYTGRPDYYDQLYSKSQGWRTDPMLITLGSHKTRDLSRLIEASVFLVSLCRELCIDIAARCPKKGKSFQEFGCIALLNQMAA